MRRLLLCCTLAAIVGQAATVHAQAAANRRTGRNRTTKTSISGWWRSGRQQASNELWRKYRSMSPADRRDAVYYPYGKTGKGDPFARDPDVSVFRGKEGGRFRYIDPGDKSKYDRPKAAGSKTNQEAWLNRLVSQFRQLEDTQKSLNSIKDRLDKEKSNEPRLLADTKKALLEAQVAKRAWEQYEYGLCPNGRSYSSCTHYERKVSYWNRKRDLWDEWKRKVRQLDPLGERLDKYLEYSACYEQKNKSYERVLAEYNADVDDYNARYSGKTGGDKPLNSSVFGYKSK